MVAAQPNFGNWIKKNLFRFFKIKKKILAKGSLIELNRM